VTWLNRLKLLAGLVVVVAIVGASTIIFTQRQSEARSTSAAITAETYTVGTDYGGSVIRQSVSVGQQVKPGQELFEVRSLSLLQAMQRNPVSFNTANYSVRPDGTMIFTASVAGIVAALNTKQGDFVQPGTDLATIYKANTLTVVGNYTLTPVTYQRVQPGGAVEVTLPNQVVLTGRVQRISVSAAANGKAQTQIVVASPALRQGGDGGLVAPGTPVLATLHLRQDGLLAGPEDTATNFLQQIGL
jgi:multidrug resistance efflux pump